MKKLIALFAVTCLVFSCSKDIDDVINVELEGKWVLTNAACYCYFGDNPDFTSNKITFTGSQLATESATDLNYLKAEEGEYAVVGNLITFTNGTKYTYVLKNTTLTLTFVDEPQIADDELTLVYERL